MTVSMQTFATREEWRAVKGYEGLYEVSNFGRVKSLGMTFKMPNGAVMVKPSKLIAACDDGKGYLRLGLSKSGKRKSFRVHRLVAEAFIPNPEKLPKVNHIDGNKMNNHVNNLEWCTQAENMAHAFKHGLATRNIPTAVIAVDNNGKLYCFESQCEASRETGVSQQNISACCRGKIKSAGGYKWEYQ